MTDDNRPIYREHFKTLALNNDFRLNAPVLYHYSYGIRAERAEDVYKL